MKAQYKYGDTIECPRFLTKVKLDDVLCPECNAELVDIDLDQIDRRQTMGSSNIITVAGIKCLSCGNVFSATYLESDDPHFTCPKCGANEAAVPED